MDGPSADEVEAIRRVYAAVPAAHSGDDEDAYLAEIHPDVEWIPLMAVLEGRVYHGHDGVRQWLSDLRNDWAVFVSVPDEIDDLGAGHWLVLGHWQARGRASGIELDDQPAAWLMHFRDGRIDRLQTFTNREEALEAAETLRSGPA